MTFSLPSWSCDNTAPIPSWLASVSRVNTSLSFGNGKTGAVDNLIFNSSNAAFDFRSRKESLIFLSTGWTLVTVNVEMR